EPAPFDRYSRHGTSVPTLASSRPEPRILTPPSARDNRGQPPVQPEAPSPFGVRGSGRSRLRPVRVQREEREAPTHMQVDPSDGRTLAERAAPSGVRPRPHPEADSGPFPLAAVTA